MELDPVPDYPLGTRRPDLVSTPSGLPLDDVTLEAARDGRARGVRRLRATPETLAAAGARSPARPGRTQLADDLERAAELTAVPDDELLEIYTALRPGRSIGGRARGVGRPARGARRAAGRRRSCARRRRSTRERGLLAVTEPDARRSGRFASRAETELRRELLVEPWAELGLVARERAGRPRAGARRRGRRRHAARRARGGRLRRDRPLPRRARARPRGRRGGDGAPDDVELARMLVDVDVPRGELVRLARGLTPAKLARVIGAARPRRADVRAEEAARAARPRQPGARHEPQGEPGAARGRRRRGRAARLRRDRDDGRRRALRAAQRARAPRRLADRPPGRDDAVRGRGAPQPRARDPRPRHVRRDALRVRHRAGVRRRRRHALVEGVPRRPRTPRAASRCASPPAPARRR